VGKRKGGILKTLGVGPQLECIRDLWMLTPQSFKRKCWGGGLAHRGGLKKRGGLGMKNLVLSLRDD